MHAMTRVQLKQLEDEWSEFRFSMEITVELSRRYKYLQHIRWHFNAQIRACFSDC